MPERCPMLQHFQPHQMLDIPYHLFRTSLVAKTKDIGNGLIEAIQHSPCNASFFRSWIEALTSPTGPQEIKRLPFLGGEWPAVVVFWNNRHTPPHRSVWESYLLATAHGEPPQP